MIQDIVARGLFDRKGREYVRLACGHAVPHESGRGHGLGARRCLVCEGQRADAVLETPGLFGKLGSGGNMAKKQDAPKKPAKAGTKPGWTKAKGVVEK